ncbi:MAG: CopD family protein [Sphingomonadales bacterium]
MLYLSLKVLHLLAVISWMAGLLYLPRLFIYHHSVSVGGEASDTFKVMEYRLSRYIMSPAMMVSWAAGLSLIYFGGHNPFQDIWLILKLLTVATMTWVHIVYLRYVKQFGDDLRPKTTRYFRVLNEAPTLLMIGIIIFVVFKPFGVLYS